MLEVHNIADLSTYDEPGVYLNLPSETYHSIKHCSNSRLKKLTESGKHLYQSLHDPVDLTTESVRRGSALDCLLLEPEDWHKWTIAGEGEKFNEGDGYKKKKAAIKKWNQRHYDNHHLNWKRQ